MTTRTRVSSILVFLIGWSSCQRSDTDNPPVVVDTLASGTVHAHAGELGRWGAEPAVRLEPTMRLGKVDANDPETFGEVWAVERDAQGRTYVIDRLAKVVRVFGTDGRHVRTVGRQGEGPGEFENPFGLGWQTPDRLWVLDVDLVRYSVFDTSGAHVGEHRRRVGGYSWPWPGQFTRDGRLIEPDLHGQREDRLVVFRASPDLQPVDSFPDPAESLASGDFWVLERDRGRSVVPVPFGRRGYRMVSPDGTVWVGHSGEYRIAQLSLQGDTIRVIERSVSPFPVSAAERTSALEPYERFLDHPAMDLSRIPDSKPFFRALSMDESGKLWVLREGRGDDWFFDVYESDGGFLGAVPLPVVPDLLPPPRIYSDAVLVTTRDSLDVQYIVELSVGVSDHDGSESDGGVFDQ